MMSESRAIKLVRDRLELIAVLAAGTKYGPEADLQAIEHHARRALAELPQPGTQNEAEQ